MASPFTKPKCLNPSATSSTSSNSSWYVSSSGSPCSSSQITAGLSFISSVCHRSRHIVVMLSPACGCVDGPAVSSLLSPVSCLLSLVSRLESSASPRLGGEINQFGNSIPFEVSNNRVYGGSNLMSRNFSTSAVNLSTSRMENSYSSSHVDTPT